VAAALTLLALKCEKRTARAESATVAGERTFLLRSVAVTGFAKADCCMNEDAS
jgi:hypothetical protein